MLESEPSSNKLQDLLKYIRIEKEKLYALFAMFLIKNMDMSIHERRKLLEESLEISLSHSQELFFISKLTKEERNTALEMVEPEFREYLLLILQILDSIHNDELLD